MRLVFYLQYTASHFLANNQYSRISLQSNILQRFRTHRYILYIRYSSEDFNPMEHRWHDKSIELKPKDYSALILTFNIFSEFKTTAISFLLLKLTCDETETFDKSIEKAYERSLYYFKEIQYSLIFLSRLFERRKERQRGKERFIPICVQII